MLKDEILNSNDLPYKTYKLPQWSTEIRITTMTGLEREQFENAWTKQRGRPDACLRALLVCFCARDQSGQRIFSEADATQLANISSVTLTEMADIAIRLNAIGAAEIEEMEKNSDSAQTV